MGMEITRRKSLWLGMLLLCLLSNCRESQEPFIHVEDEAVSLLDSFLEDEVVFVQTDRDLEIYKKIKEKYGKELLLNDDSLHLKIWKVYSVLCKHCLSSFAVIENLKTKNFYLFGERERDFRFYKEAWDRFPNSYKAMYAYQEMDFQGVEDFLNESNIEFDELREGLIDTFYLASFYPKNQLLSNKTLLKKVQNEKELEDYATDYWNQRLEKASFTLENKEAYRKSKEELFDFLRELLSTEEEKKELGIGRKTKVYLYFDGFFFHAISLHFYPDSRYIKRRYQLDYYLL